MLPQLFDWAFGIQLLHILDLWDPQHIFNIFEALAKIICKCRQEQ